MTPQNFNEQTSNKCLDFHLEKPFCICDWILKYYYYYDKAPAQAYGSNKQPLDKAEYSNVLMRTH